MKMLRSLALLSAFSAAIACAGRLPAQNAIGRIGDVSIPQVTVNFGMKPYPPHTDAIIVSRQGLVQRRRHRFAVEKTCRQIKSRRC